MDEVTDPSLSILAEGHQWYWSYEYSDFLNSNENFTEWDGNLLHGDGDLLDSGGNLLDSYLDSIANKLNEWFKFKITKCSSPHEANKAFGKSLDNNLPSNSVDSNNPTVPHLDINSIDRKLADLKSTINSVTDTGTNIRIDALKASIDSNFIELDKMSTKALNELLLCTRHLSLKLIDIAFNDGCRDFLDILNKGADEIGNSSPLPNKELCKTDPIGYWNDRIKSSNSHANKIHESSSIIKKYLIAKQEVSPQNRSLGIFKLKELNKLASSTTDADIALSRKNLEYSKIIAELNKARGK